MQSTLLLAASYEPLDVIPWQDAIRLMFLNKVEVIEEYEEDLRSSYLVIKMPAVVRLLRMFKRNKKKQVKFSRINIYTRDKFKCQYCKKKGTMKDFTFDHVIPRAKGGTTCWENIVTACAKCNTKKGSKTPREASMKLIKKPKKPKWLPGVSIKINQKSVPAAWRDYLYWNLSLDED